MPLETFPFDAADYLDTPTAMAWFLIDAAEDNDPAVMADALSIVARARRRFAERSTPVVLGRR